MEHISIWSVQILFEKAGVYYKRYIKACIEFLKKLRY